MTKSNSTEKVRHACGLCGRKVSFCLILMLGMLWTSTQLSAQDSKLPMEDRIRLSEAFALAQDVGDSVWEAWSEVPFTLLLVTEEHEFLFNHDNPTDDFENLGFDSMLHTNVYVRPNSGRYSTNFLATFPAINGQNTVVMGRPAATGKTSTEWVLTALHEHFHQLQFSQPHYWDRVAALDLSGGDESGMWMLNYPYPYESKTVQVAFEKLETALAAALENPDLSALKRVSESRKSLRQLLSAPEYRYQSFQLWQEGVARYTEIRVADWAAKNHSQSPAFQVLSDFEPYESVHAELLKSISDELLSHNVADIGRVAFYAFGAAEALLLDHQDSAWRAHYFEDMPYLESHTVKF